MKLRMQNGRGLLALFDTQIDWVPLMIEETQDLIIGSIDEQRTQENRRLMSLNRAIKIRRNKNETPKR